MDQMDSPKAVQRAALMDFPRWARATGTSQLCRSRKAYQYCMCHTLPGPAVLPYCSPARAASAARSLVAACPADAGDAGVLGKFKLMTS